MGAQFRGIFLAYVLLPFWSAIGRVGMQMSGEEERDRSKPELVFGLLRALVNARLLWGTASSLSIASLQQLLRATPEQLNGALAYLLDRELVQVDVQAEAVQLSDAALRKLIG